MNEYKFVALPLRQFHSALFPLSGCDAHRSDRISGYESFLLGPTWNFPQILQETASNGCLQHGFVSSLMLISTIAFEFPSWHFRVLFLEILKYFVWVPFAEPSLLNWIFLTPSQNYSTIWVCAFRCYFLDTRCEGKLKSVLRCAFGSDFVNENGCAFSSSPLAKSSFLGAQRRSTPL